MLGSTASSAKLNSSRLLAGIAILAAAAILLWSLHQVWRAQIEPTSAIERPLPRLSFDAALEEARALKNNSTVEARSDGDAAKFARFQLAIEALRRHQPRDRDEELRRAEGLLDLMEAATYIAATGAEEESRRLALGTLAYEKLLPMITPEALATDAVLRTSWVRVNYLLGNLWTIRYRDDEGEKALEYYGKALEAAESYSEGTRRDQFETYTWIPTVLSQRAILQQILGGSVDATRDVEEAVDLANRQAAAATTPQAFQQLGFVHANAAEVYRRQQKHEKELHAAQTGTARFAEVTRLGGKVTPLFLSTKAALHTAIATAERNKNKSRGPRESQTISSEQRRENFRSALAQYMAARDIWRGLLDTAPRNRAYMERYAFLEACVAEVALPVGTPEALEQSIESSAAAMTGFQALYVREAHFAHGLVGPRITLQGTDHLFGKIGADRSMRLMPLRLRLSSRMAVGWPIATSRLVMQTTNLLPRRHPRIARALAGRTAAGLIHLRLLTGAVLDDGARRALEKMIADERELIVRSRLRPTAEMAAAASADSVGTAGRASRVLAWCQQSAAYERIRARLPWLRKRCS